MDKQQKQIKDAIKEADRLTNSIELRHLHRELKKQKRTWFVRLLIKLSLIDLKRKP